MVKTITIPIEKYNVLRETFKSAIEIIDSLGVAGGLASERKTSKPVPKRTKTQKINDYKKLIESGERVKKPEHLKK